MNVTNRDELGQSQRSASESPVLLPVLVASTLAAVCGASGMALAVGGLCTLQIGIGVGLITLPFAFGLCFVGGHLLVGMGEAYVEHLESRPRR